MVKHPLARRKTLDSSVGAGVLCTLRPTLDSFVWRLAINTHDNDGVTEDERPLAPTATTEQDDKATAEATPFDASKQQTFVLLFEDLHCFPAHLVPPDDGVNGTKDERP
jgi:hypothetical protein